MDNEYEDKKPSKAKVAAGTMDSDEYLRKRERNNIAVRKSRRKAKQKIEETRKRVNELASENDNLRSKVTLLQKELTVLRSLFANGGIQLPSDLSVQISASNGNSVPVVMNSFTVSPTASSGTVTLTISNTNGEVEKTPKVKTEPSF